MLPLHYRANNNRYTLIIFPSGLFVNPFHTAILRFRSDQTLQQRAFFGIPRTDGKVLREVGDGDDTHRSDTANYQSPSHENHEGRFAVHASQLLGVCAFMADLRALHRFFRIDLERNFLPHCHHDLGHAENFL